MPAVAKRELSKRYVARDVKHNAYFDVLNFGDDADIVADVHAVHKILNKSSSVSHKSTAAHVTRHTSHVTHHTSHITHHTSNVTPDPTPHLTFKFRMTLTTWAAAASNIIKDAMPAREDCCCALELASSALARRILRDL